VSKIVINKFSKLKNTKFYIALILWGLFSVALYSGFMEIELKNNLEMSLVMGAALVLLILHIIKILRQMAIQNL